MYRFKNSEITGTFANDLKSRLYSQMKRINKKKPPLRHRWRWLQLVAKNLGLTKSTHTDHLHFRVCVLKHASSTKCEHCFRMPLVLFNPHDCAYELYVYSVEGAWKNATGKRQLEYQELTVARPLRLWLKPKQYMWAVEAKLIGLANLDKLPHAAAVERKVSSFRLSGHRNTELHVLFEQSPNRKAFRGGLTDNDIQVSISLITETLKALAFRRTYDEECGRG